MTLMTHAGRRTAPWAFTEFMSHLMCKDLRENTSFKGISPEAGINGSLFHPCFLPITALLVPVSLETPLASSSKLL
jgi:hypothetical protein